MFFRAGVSPQRLKAGAENKPVIAAVNRCATQKQAQTQLFPQAVKAVRFPFWTDHGLRVVLDGASPVFTRHFGANCNADRKSGPGGWGPEEENPRKLFPLNHLRP